MKVDVVMLTKNSYSKQPKVFTRCLQSIKENVPVNRFIVVDAYSTDETIDVIKKYLNDVVVVKSRAYRGKAREIGIKFVETEYFMFVDDDVILCKDWFKKAIRYFEDPKVGAVWGVDIPANPHVLNRVLTVTKVFRYKDFRDKLIENCRWRGGTHDILIRTEIVKDITIPNHFHIYEDWYIKSWIERKGYRFVMTKDPYCIHFVKNARRSDWLETARWEAMLDLRYGLRTFREIVKLFILTIPKCLAILLLTGDLKAAQDQWWYYQYLFVYAVKVRGLINDGRGIFQAEGSQSSRAT